MKQLAAQDYPVDKINEVVVSKASSQNSGSEDMQKLLRDFRCSSDDNLNLGAELAGCSGQIVALWGDAQVSVPQRLRTQVARSLAAKSATLLQPTWFFDRVSQEFQKVTEWPTDVLEDASMKIFACADALTLCTDRAGLAELVADVQPNLPEDELKEVLQKLPQPRLIDDLSWAAVQSPPVIAKVASAEPDKDLAGLVKEAWPQGAQDDTETSLEPVLKQIEESKSKPAQAIEALLSHKLDQAADDITLRRVKALIEDSLKRNGAGSVAEAVAVLKDWKGLVIGKSDAQDSKTFPVFFQAFSVLRTYTTDYVDEFDMAHIGQTAERFVLLAKTMWAADSRITEAMSMVLSKELYQSGEDKPPPREDGQKQGQNPDTGTVSHVVATLGLTKMLRELAYAAMDIPNSLITADAMSSLVWALGESGVENSPLSIKAAKTLIQNVDKLTPVHIGQIFVAMHERKWFRDEDAIAYLTQTLMARIKELKDQDPGLAKILAEKAEITETPETVNQ